MVENGIAFMAFMLAVLAGAMALVGVKLLIAEFFRPRH